MKVWLVRVRSSEESCFCVDSIKMLVLWYISRLYRQFEQYVYIKSPPA